MGANKGMLSYEMRSSDVGPTFVGQSILECSETQKHKLGARLVLGERVFRYCEDAGSGLSAAQLVQAAAPVAHHNNVAASAAVAAGGYQVIPTLGATAAAINLYQNGWLHVNDAAGEGQLYRIKSHPAADASATLTVTLYDQIITALTTSSEVTLTQNLYKDVIVVPTTLTGAVVGVNLIDITASYYFWAQTKGPCAVLTAGTVVIGNNVCPITTAGAVGPLATDSILPIVGRVIQVNASEEYSLIDLNLE